MKVKHSERRDSALGQAFCVGAAGLILLAAGMKGISLAADFPGASDPDPIIWFLPKNLLSVLLVGLETWVAIYVLSGNRRQDQYGAILLLSSGFLGYRLAKWLYLRNSSCECFGSIFSAWGNEHLDLVALAITVGLLAGSLLGIVVMGKQRRSGLE